MEQTGKFSAQGGQMKDATLLVLDENSPRRSMLNVLLSAAGCRVLQAPTLHDGLRLAGRMRPDLVICSLTLPDGRAEDLPHLLHQTGIARDLPVIGLAAQNDYSGRLRALGAGLDEVLMTPIEDRVLLARLRALLRPVPVPGHASQPQPGFAEPLVQLVSAVDVARLTLVGSRDDLMRPCFEALQDHPDLYLTPLMRQLYTAEPPLVAGLLMQVANLQDLESLRQITEGHSRERPCVIALATPDYYLPALEAGAEDAIPLPADPREILIRVRSLMRRRAQARSRIHGPVELPQPMLHGTS